MLLFSFRFVRGEFPSLAQDPVRGIRLPLWTALSRPLSAVTAASCLNEGGFGLNLKAVPQPNSRQLMLGLVTKQDWLHDTPSRTLLSEASETWSS